MLPPVAYKGRMGLMSERESRYTNGEATFDELAKGLAVGVSRRKALRLMGAALVGGALASFPGAAWSEQQLDKVKKPHKPKKPDPDAPPTLPQQQLSHQQLDKEKKPIKAKKPKDKDGEFPPTEP